MPPEPVVDAMMSFLTASTWDESFGILRVHPELLGLGVEFIDVLLKDPTVAYPGLSRSEAAARLRAHRAVLVRCRTVGTAAAFAEIGRGTSRRREHHGAAWFWALTTIAVIVVVVILGIRFLHKSSAPGGVVASALGKYRIKVSWSDSAKKITGFNIDNGCPAGTCGGHGVTLAKTTGPVTSTVFRVTPGTYQCFRVQAITKSGLSGWSGYGCTSTPSLMISGTQAWIPTRVTLKSGDRLEIRAAGLMSIGSSSGKSPAGKPSCKPAVNDAATASSFPAPKLPCLSLIARIGNRRAFEVGTSAVVIAQHGRLYVGVNASDFSGSSGSWTVNIKIGGTPPTP